MLSAERLCDVCERPFVAKSYAARQLYCSQRCKRTVDDERPAIRPPTLKRSTGTVGAISELVACADLLKRGYDVFRAVSQSCSCDLIAVKDMKSTRIEVRTGYFNNRSVLVYSKKKGESPRYDVMVVVTKNGDLYYLPGLPGDDDVR